MKKKKQKEKLITTPEHQKRLRARIGLVAFLSLLIVSLLSFNFYPQGAQTWSRIDSNLNIFLLINLNIILLITVIALIIRNMIKLIYERRQRKLGFRLKFKLTLAFILISSLPMLLLYFIASGFLTSSLDFWFKGQFSVALQNSTKVINNLTRERGNELKHYVKILAVDYQETIQSEPVSNEGSSREVAEYAGIISPTPLKKDERQDEWFSEVLFRYNLSSIVWYDATLTPIKTRFSDSDKQKFWKPLPSIALKNTTSEFPAHFNLKMDNAEISRVITDVVINKNTYYLEISKIITGQRYDDLATVLKNIDDHRNFLSLEGPIKTNYTTYLLLFTVLAIFGGTWFGYYLARSIVEPIETLVEGTRRISKGDLDFQIDLQVDDEISMLLDSFNSMTKELQQNRKKLANSREELLETNKTLEERNIFVELVLQNIRSGIFSVDNQGYIKVINPYMEKMFQIDRSKVVTKHYRSAFTKEQISLFEHLNGQLLPMETNSIQGDFHLKVDKKHIHVSMELFPLTNQKGEQLGRLLVVDDLSELDRSTRARAWREVARRIAHEIKNPLTPIQLSAQRIRRKYLDNMEDGEMLDNCTSTIIDAVYGLKNMVNEFSKFARLPEINPSPANINAILEDTCNLFKPGLPKRVKLDLDMDQSVPEGLLDGDQIKRVFTNLIDNAVAAMPDGGTVHLKSTYAREFKMVTISITDTGTGIPSEMMNRVFDPYVTTKQDGTGLGLAIVQQIIFDHNGFIRVENKDQKGTRFTIELPV